MMRSSLLLLLAACGAVTTTPNPTDRPDGGVPTSDGGSADPDGAVPGDGTTASITVIAAHLADERGDAISFASGEPIHTHAGPMIDLGGSGCPDVYIYPYLHDATAPAWGGETAPNPLAWQLAIAGATGTYQVRADDGTLLVDSTPIAGDTIVLRRTAIPKLGTREGGMLLEVTAGAAHRTFCWKHHPLAAPVELLPIAQAAAEDVPLWAMSLPGDSPLSELLQAQATVPAVIEQRVVQHTGEPIALAIALAPPTGHFTKTIASWYAKTAGGTLDCGTSEQPSDDPRCASHALTSTTTPSAGVLASGAWHLHVVDEATGSQVCAPSGLEATCLLPPRAAGAPPHAYRVVGSVDALADLWPAVAGPFAEYSVLGRSYTGLAPVTVSRCDARSVTTVGLTQHYACAYSTYAHLIALDAATLAFDPFALAYQASPGQGVPLAALPYAPAPQTSGALTWSAGVEVLPGQ